MTGMQRNLIDISLWRGSEAVFMLLPLTLSHARPRPISLGIVHHRMCEKAVSHIIYDIYMKEIERTKK
jgi:hypothetical protein